MGIKLLSVNVEQDKHLYKVRRLIVEENPDVVVLLEICQDDLEMLTPEYQHRVYLSNFKYEDGREFGVALVAKSPIERQEKMYCDGDTSKNVPHHGMGTHRPAVVMGEISGYKILATHFTWTDGGLVTRRQKEDFVRLWQEVEGEEMVLVGDFNLPRNMPGGNEIYTEMAKRLVDNIPLDITTTIDPHLHRVNQGNPGKLAWMVDYVWSTPKYKVSGVRVVTGVSDHFALVCDIESLS